MCACAAYRLPCRIEALLPGRRPRYFGRSDGTVDNGGAYAGCDGDPPVTGYVANNTDCDDTNMNTYPGQTNYFFDGLDHNCNGIIELNPNGDGSTR